MLQLIILSIILGCISAQWSSYNQGYGHKIHSGFNQGGLHSYNSDSHGSHRHGYDYSFAVKHKPIHKPVYHRQYLYVNQPIIKRLPPIYKYVKQPVYIEQPVIIKKIPLIKHIKPVTVKNLPPIIKHVEPTIDVKTVDVKGVKKEMNVPEIPVVEIFKNTKSVTVKNLPPIIKHKEPTIDVNGVKYAINVHEMPVMVVPKGQTPEFGMRIPKKEDNSNVMPEIDRKEETRRMHGLGNGADFGNELNRGMMADRKTGQESGTDNNGDFNGSDFDV